jgi:hypothetical protein
MHRRKRLCYIDCGPEIRFRAVTVFKLSNALYVSPPIPQPPVKFLFSLQNSCKPFFQKGR